MIVRSDAKLGQLLDALLDEARFAESVEHDRAAFTRERLRDRKADAVQGSGNQSAFSIQQGNSSHC